jgi:hypothetical protein
METVPERKVVSKLHVTLPFIQEIPGVKPYRIIGPFPPEREPDRTNVRSVNIEGVLLHSAWLNQAGFWIDCHGFEFMSFQSETQLVGDDENTPQSFLNEIGALLENQFHTPHVLPYDSASGKSVFFSCSV